MAILLLWKSVPSNGSKEKKRQAKGLPHHKQQYKYSQRHKPIFNPDQREHMRQHHRAGMSHLHFLYRCLVFYQKNYIKQNRIFNLFMKGSDKKYHRKQFRFLKTYFPYLHKKNSFLMILHKCCSHPYCHQQIIQHHLIQFQLWFQHI